MYQPIPNKPNTKREGTPMQMYLLPPSRIPNELFFSDALQEEGGDENPLLYLDAQEWLKPKEWLGKAFHLSIDYNTFLRGPKIDNFLNNLDNSEIMGHNEPFDTLAFAICAKATIPKAEVLHPTWHGDHSKSSAAPWKIQHNSHAFNYKHPCMTTQSHGPRG